MAGERDVLAEALHEAYTLGWRDHEAGISPRQPDTERVLAALAARGYTLSRSEPERVWDEDHWQWVEVVAPPKPGSRPGREDEAYAAGRLAGFEEGLAAVPSPEPLPLDVERLFRVLWVTPVYHAFANDQQRGQEQRFRDWAAAIAREYRDIKPSSDE